MKSLFLTVVVLMVAIANVAHADAKSFMDAVKVTLGPDRTVLIITPWGGRYVAYDQGVEKIVVTTSAKFKSNQMAVPALPSGSGSNNMDNLDADVSLEPITVQGTRYHTMSVAVMYDVEPGKLNRPVLRRGYSYVNLSWIPSQNPMPYIFAVDLQTGYVARAYWSGGADEWASEEFGIPDSMVAHRTVFLFFRSRSAPTALAIRSIGWHTYRGYRNGQDVSAGEAKHLLRLDPSYARTYREADIDMKRYDAIKNRPTITIEYPPSEETGGASFKSCRHPDVDARASRQVKPDYPEIARQKDETGSVQVKVSISATGSLTDATLFKSSGSQALDDSAVQAAREASYRPAVKNCKPIDSTVLFTFDFQTE